MDLETARRILIAHSRAKKNGMFPADSNVEAKLSHPICGDSVQLKMRTQDGKIDALGYLVQACAICTASTSLLCEEVSQLSISNAMQLAANFEAAIIAPQGTDWHETLKRFQCFEHIRVNPARRTCALLPFVLLRSLLTKIERSSAAGADPR